MARVPTHASPAAPRYVGNRSTRCAGQIRRLYVSLWLPSGEHHERRLHPVGWACTKCGRARVEREQLAQLDLVHGNAGATTLRLRSSSTG